MRGEGGGERPTFAVATGPVRAGALALLGIAAVAGGAMGLAALAQEEPFPHADHAGLFPLCTGCHEGMETGTAAERFPEPSSCEGCHDGVEEERVDWSGRQPEPSTLDFDHVDHARAVRAEGDREPTCQRCHADVGAVRMTVDSLEAGRCLNCHAHEADPERHYEVADCRQCHLPLAETGLPVERIAAVPVPADHESGAFIREIHGSRAPEEVARCATCHTRERCAACHVDVDRPSIQALPTAPADMELPPLVAHYPVPKSHEGAVFSLEHGRGLGPSSAVEACATCHTSDDCASCHVGRSQVIEALPPRPTVSAVHRGGRGIGGGPGAAGPETEGQGPSRDPGTAEPQERGPGVGLEPRRPDTHRTPFFLRSHATLASADQASCATCHETDYCDACHEAPRGALFHPDNFVTRHAAASFGALSECANCHDTELFCRSCHVQSGFGSQGRLGPGYHDAEPFWLFRHGQAARQELESCASCHDQRECLQCHSQIGAFQVNPHGPGFDARRAWERNPGICLACHIASPFGSGG